MKKTIVRVISFVAFFAMVINLFTVFVFASSSALTLRVSDVSGKPGEEVQVPVVLSNNTGIASLKFKVMYDQYLTLTNVVFDSAFGVYVTSPKPYTNPQTISMISPLSDVTANGTFATLTFKISEDAPDNYNANVCITYAANDVFDGEYNNIELTVIDGIVKVYHGLPGDINGDGSVDNKDAIILFRYVAGWDVDVDSGAIDVNGDGETDNKDAIILFRYVADWPGITLVRGEVCRHSELTAVSAKAADCVNAGNIAYWNCENCEKLFSDAEAKNQIALNDTVIEATGHTEVIDEAVAPTYDKTGLTEGSHCSVCNTVIKAQEVVEALRADYYAITYSNLQGADVPALNQYAAHIGVSDEDMPKPELTGYKFEGWYTAIEGGTRVSDIPAGSHQNYHLYARWSTIKYNITYKDASVHTNPYTYTIEDEIVLSAPEWSGLSFKNWTRDGNEITKIPRGSVGDIIVHANWISEKNMAIPSKDKEAKTVLFDTDHDRYYFIYEIGTIENIVLSTLGTDDKSAGEELKWTVDKTVSIEDNIADSIARTVSQSVSQTSEWEQTKELVVAESVSSTITAELEFADIGKIGAAIGATSSVEGTVGYGTSGSTSGGTETSNSVSSTVSYTKGISTTITKEITISSGMPKGKYSYVCAGTVRVYAVVTYDPNNQNYYIDTYSVLDDNTYEKRLYEAPADTTANISYSEGLPCDIPMDEIVAYVNSVYYVKYDANGGVGNMLTSVYKTGETSNLAENEFVRDGFTFTGWGTEPDGAALYVDNAEIQNIAASDETITLYAIWTPIKYTAQWNGGKGYSIKVERTSSPIVGADAAVLNSGDTVYYGDVLKITYTNSKGYSITGHGIESATIVASLSSRDIYATATPNNYTVEYNANGGTGTMYASQHIYDQAQALSANAFTRHGWNFVGWNTKADGSGTFYSNKQSVKNLSSGVNGKVTLYAVWNLVATTNYTFDTFEVNNGFDGSNGFYVTLTDVFDMEYLRAQGYSMKVSMNFTLDYSHEYKYRFMIFNGTSDLDTKLYTNEQGGYLTGAHNRNLVNVVNVKCNSLGKNQLGFLFCEDTWAAFGVITNRYNVKNLVMSVTFEK